MKASISSNVVFSNQYSVGGLPATVFDGFDGLVVLPDDLMVAFNELQDFVY